MYRVTVDGETVKAGLEHNEALKWRAAIAVMAMHTAAEMPMIRIEKEEE